MTRQALIAKLTEIQNHPANWDRDILTITGFMTDEQVAAHIEREAARLDKAS